MAEELDSQLRRQPGHLSLYSCVCVSFFREINKKSSAKKRGNPSPLPLSTVDCHRIAFETPVF